ncbi:hypothetical protein SAMN05421827_10716 [Pedobacter terrae]|uniref:PH (Pleckstrin Homology) domain-containing protein n=1 Tax=Pedobacter terrae TaxID=405671 RepID=A0A1G7UKV9_9SPHI|nr:hypothetical protein [Pedobacter terrae]SDG47988.1 hypothetical protein SAMN05421827_10716 [Pedobacter terrae]
MLKSIKVKDNGNIFIMIYIFSMFPLFFVAPIFMFDLSCAQSAIISMSVLIVFFIFYFKNLIAKQDEYAIIADENEITLLNLGTFKWTEIRLIKAFDESFGRRRYSYINIILENGRKFKIESTNFDYPNQELETILNALGKLTG